MGGFGVNLGKGMCLLDPKLSQAGVGGCACVLWCCSSRVSRGCEVRGPCLEIGDLKVLFKTSHSMIYGAGLWGSLNS